MQHTFGDALRYTRRECRDPQRGGPLTQDRLADLLSQFDDNLIYTKKQISQWECNQRKITWENRTLLVGLVSVFLHHGGLADIEAANRFLTLGRYGHLSAEEEARLRPASQAAEPTLPASGQVDSAPADAIKQLIDTLQAQIDDNRRLQEELLRYRVHRQSEIDQLSQTQWRVLAVVPQEPMREVAIFRLLRAEVRPLESATLAELRLRLSELRHLSLVNRERASHGWLYWRLEPPSQNPYNLFNTPFRPHTHHATISTPLLPAAEAR